MPIHDLVDVSILSNRQPLQEYPVPDGETNASNENVCYIEATAGERFEIMVRYEVGYRVENAANLVVELYLDGQKFINSPIKRTSLRVRQGILALASEHEYSSFALNVTKTLAKEYHYAFGAVELTETASKEVQYDQERLDNMGEIKVVVYRGGKATTNAEPHISPFPKIYEQVPAKRMGGRLLKNNVRYDELNSQPATLATMCPPLPGKNGRKTVFVFRYRSKKILQLLGCIERSPSPEPDYALVAERQEEMIKDGKEKARKANLEILKLRQQLAQVETAQGVKRKREGDSDDDDIKEMAPPPKKMAIMVDLTEDDE